MGTGNRPGIITLPRLGLFKGTSRGFMDNKTAGANWDKLDAVAGSMHYYSMLVGFNPTTLTNDVWEKVNIPNALQAALGATPSADFDYFVRFSNVVKVLCARFRSIQAGGGGQTLEVMLKKSNPTSPLATDPNCLINPVVFVNNQANIQNLSGLGVEDEAAPVIGAAADEVISLWMKKETGYAAPALIWMEIFIAVQMIEDAPPAEIIDAT